MTRPMPTMMWMRGFPKMEVMIVIESLSMSFQFRTKNKSLGII
jgi:hypothetical protein